jgi:hypothetical protein
MNDICTQKKATQKNADMRLPTSHIKHYYFKVHFNIILPPERPSRGTFTSDS